MSRAFDRVGGYSPIRDNEVFDFASCNSLLVDEDEAPVGEHEQVSEDAKGNMNGLIGQEKAIELFGRLLWCDVTRMTEETA